MISSAAVELAIANKIPIFFVDRTGDIIGRLWSSELSHYNQLRRLQVLALESDDFRIAEMKLIFGEKTNNQISILKQLSKQYGSKKENQQTTKDIELHLEEILTPSELAFEEERSRLMGYEGTVAKIYWRQLNDFLDPEWQFEERSRRPAKDPFNALLNYCYGMLYHVVEQAIFASGMDPRFGLMHRDQIDEPTLSFDLIEPFRPWFDYCLVEHIRNQEILIESCEPDPERGWIIEKQARRKLIQMVNTELLREREMDDRVMGIRSHIFRYSDLYAERIRAFMEQNK